MKTNIISQAITAVAIPVLAAMPIVATSQVSPTQTITQETDQTATVTMTQSPSPTEAETSTPSITEAPTAEVTTEPTVTPTAEVTTEPADTDQTDQSPTPTQEASPTAQLTTGPSITQEPSLTPDEEPSSVPDQEPSITEEPSENPTPSITEEPTVTQEPTETPVPSPSITETVTPSPTETPVPTDTVTPTPSPTEAPVNQAPTVDAGDDATIQLPQDTYTMQGSYADDGLPSSQLQMSWRLVNAPASISFVAFDLTSPTVQFSEPGEYTFRFTVSDTQLQSSDEVTITVLPAEDPVDPAPLAPVIESVTRTSNICYTFGFFGSFCFTSIAIQGSDFDQGATVQYATAGSGMWIDIYGNGYQSSESLTPSLSYLSKGVTFDIKVTNPDGQSVIYESAFTTAD